MKRTARLLYQHPFLLFALFVFIVYLPVFLPFFHLKNDLVTQNLPTRFVISESLYSGYFPWWNPYIHYGIPQYGDMNNGFWNPFLWLIAKTVGNSIYTITWEEMFYLLLGGWGMFKLIKEFFSKETALLIGLSYLCCGYAVGHLQHFIWITGLAFFPYVLLFFARTHKNPVVKNFIGCGISIFFFLSSTHPGLIIGAGYFFIFLFAFIFLFRNSVTKELYSRKFWLINLLLLITGAVSSLIVITSNLDVLNHISRGSKVSLNETLLNPTTIQSYFSLLFPLPVHKSNFFATDISMRNVYGGMALIFGLFFYFKNTDRKVILYSLVPVLFFILLASGGWFKTFAWHAFPLTGYVRMNGEFTYFVILILFLLAAGGLDTVLKNNVLKNQVTRISKILLVLFVLTAVIGLIVILITRSSILFSADQGYGKTFIKSVFEDLSFADLLVIQSIILFLTILMIKKFRSNFSALGFIVCINLIITTWLCLPFTGLGMKSKTEIQSVINSSQKGILPQELIPVNETKFIQPGTKREFIMLSSYSKKIGHPKMEEYPVQLNSSEAYFNDSLLVNFINRQAWLFLSTDTTVNASTDFSPSSISILENGPGKIKCSVNNNGFKYFVLLQNNYPFWNVSINGNKQEHFTAFKTFITVPLEGGTHIVEFDFNPAPVKKVLWANGVIIALFIVALSLKNIRNKRLFK
jgi:hypothetical protein